MTIVVTGAGSGGHITPILAVAAELKKQRSDSRIVYIGQRGDKLSDVPQKDKNIDEAYVIHAGKFRRYHGEGWHQIYDLKTQYLNIRDGFRVLAGFVQSWMLLGKIKPDVVFTRGSFVSVPVALSAKLRRIPYITHDSDSTPSLANRIIARGAEMHAVALPEDNYPYPRRKTIQVGVPISTNYRLVGAKEQLQFKDELGLNKYKWVICVTGGGNGARKLNEVVLANASYLLKQQPSLAVLHIAGRDLADGLSLEYDKQLSTADRKRVIVKPFVTDLFRYSGAADVVIARGGATNLAEFAAQGKPCIIIPSSQLVWNVKNAKALAAEKAIIELSEEHAEQERRLATLIIELLENPEQRQELAKKFIQFSRPNATADIAKLILETAAAKQG